MKFGLFYIFFLFVFLDILNVKRYKDVEKCGEEEEEFLFYFLKN